MHQVVLLGLDPGAHIGLVRQGLHIVVAAARCGGIVPGRNRCGSCTPRLAAAESALDHPLVAQHIGRHVDGFPSLADQFGIDGVETRRRAIGDAHRRRDRRLCAAEKVWAPRSPAAMRRPGRRYLSARKKTSRLAVPTGIRVRHRAASAAARRNPCRRRGRGGSAPAPPRRSSRHCRRKGPAAAKPASSRLRRRNASSARRIAPLAATPPAATSAWAALRRIGEQAQGGAAAIDDHVHRRRLERGAEVGDIGIGQRRDAFRLQPHRRLQAGEGKVGVAFARPSGGGNRIGSDRR